ncbi:MAG: tRNA lysidine(34) synthetase TilS [Patescibacteria group bacterium]
MKKRFPQKSLEARVLGSILSYQLIQSTDHIIVAVSGGADSVCLLHLLNNLKDELKITLSACHFNHKLRGKESDKDQKFVEDLCKEKGIALILGEGEKGEDLKSEEKARDARYRFFKKLIGEKRGVKIALGHNSNDLSETLIFRLARGSGMLGLSGIPISRENFIRPLLYIPRMEIEKFLKNHDLGFKTDRTNFETKYSRNLIRLKVLPVLAEINLSVVSTIAQESKNISQDITYLRKMAEESFEKIAILENQNKIVLDQKKWLKLDPSLQRNTIILAIEKISSKTDITSVQIEEVLSLISRNIGKKYKSLPHSLRVTLQNGKISCARN